MPSFLSPLTPSFPPYPKKKGGGKGKGRKKSGRRHE